MNKTNLLTIAMPVYERTDYFRDALQSALNQTFKCEVIVVDNCSSHNRFKDICNENGVKYYRNKTNLGLYGNWNRCFELAKTKYVMILGDDDLLMPKYVESFVESSSSHKNIDIYFSDFVLNNYTQGRELLHKHVFPFGYMENGAKIIEYGIKYRLGYPFITSSVKKEKFTGFFTELTGSNDWLWVYKNADKMSFYGDNRKLYKFGVHDMQASTKYSRFNLMTIIYIYEKVLKEKVLDSKLKKMAMHNSFWTFVKLRANAEKYSILELRNGTTFFSKFLNKKLHEDILFRLIVNLPKWFVNFLWRFLRKIQLVH